jgi:hypothetical protein
MLVTATTLLDSPENVRFFVAANLASGVDHMFVFLDAPRAPGQREVAELLDAEPRVTRVSTGRKTWWRDGRPPGLNVRQRINANWVRRLLEPLPWADWLFHIDGDEVARLDPDVLASVPAGTDAVWLSPWEAVSEPDPPRRPVLFKRLLNDEDLNLLHVLGALPEPTNQAYFHGHVMGKSGVRPASGLGLSLHHAVTPGGDRARSHHDGRLAVLHYDAVSGAEFVRKWSALAGAGHARYRKSRAPMARALQSLATRDLPDPVRETYLRRIYDLTTRDDVDLLQDLGLLTQVDPEHDLHEPTGLPAAAADQLAARMDEMREEPKKGYLVPDRIADGGRARSPRRGAARSTASRLRRLGRT